MMASAAGTAWLCALAALAFIVPGTTATDELTDVACDDGFEPALIHTWYGEMIDPTDTEEQRGLTKLGYKVFRNVRRHAGLSNAATTFVNDLGKVAGFLCFQDVAKRKLGPVAGLAYYWGSPLHAQLGDKFVAAVKKNEDGQGAANLQYQVCVPEKYRGHPTGKYHINMILDVEGKSGCSQTVLDFAKSAYGLLDKYGDDFMAEVPVMCGQQTAIYTAAIPSRGFHYNFQCVTYDEKEECTRYDTNDVGCVYNFDTKKRRDMAYDLLMQNPEVPSEVRKCVKMSWFAALD